MGLYKRLFKKKQQLASTGTADNHGLVETPRPEQAASDAEHFERPSEISLPPSLWRDAASQLQPKEQAKLNALLKSKRLAKDCQDLDPSMADIDLVISRTKELEEGSRLTTCRPILAKITKAAIAIKKVGDTAADLDKSGYAAIGWSVVSAGLQVAVNAEMARQFVLTSSEFTTALLTRYAKYEAELRGPHAGEEFDNRIVNVYKAILLYVIALDTFLGRCVAGRIGHAFGKIEDRTISQRKTEVVEADDLVKEWLPIIQHISQKHEFSKLHQRSDIGPSPALLATQDCSKSLAYFNMDARSGGIKAAAAGTCSWLLNHRTYQDWTSRKTGLLWIKGKPGSGKSTLLRYVLDQTTNESSGAVANSNGVGSSHNHPALVLSFFFHDRGVELQKKPMGLFRTFLFQLLKQAPEALQDLLKTYEDRCRSRGEPGKDWQWQLQEMQDFLTVALRRVLASRPVRIFVDALDEGGRDNAVMLVTWFKSLLKSFSGAGSTFDGYPCHICFTCRHYPILSLDYGLEICVEQENGNDISTFVHNELSESQIPPELVIQRANGIFMWCVLVVKRLQFAEMDATANIEEEIKRIPPRLDDLYLSLVDNIENKTDSLRLMQWVCFSARPLTLDELRWAMAMASKCPHQSLEQCLGSKNCAPGDEMLKRRLKSLSGGLVETVESFENGESIEFVQFIHQSAKDFFLNNGLSTLMVGKSTDTATTRSIHDFGEDVKAASAAHYQLTQSCLRYLSMEEFHDGTILFYSTAEGLASAFPLGTYATTKWIYHAKQIEEGKQEDIMNFLAWPSTDLLDSWIRLNRDVSHESEGRPSKNTQLHHIAAYHGMDGLLRAILSRDLDIEDDFDIDSRDEDGKTALSWAVQNGNESLVHMLLESANVDADGADYRYCTPLSRAVEGGHTSIVKLLLRRPREEIDVNSRDEAGTTPLGKAAYFGRDTIARLLLDVAETDVNAKDNGGGTPLMMAAGEGQEVLVRILLNAKGVNPDGRDDNGWTPLIWAARNGHEAVVRLLLRGGLRTGSADMEHRDVYGRTALSWTAEYGHEAVVWILLGLGKADINTKDNEDTTPLSWAAREGRDAVVRALLRNEKVDIDSKDCEGRTALFLAARAGSETIVRQLLKTGKVDVDATDKQGDTPLSVAVEKGHLNVAQLLRPFAEASRPPMEENDSIATAEDDSSTVVGESPTTDVSSMMMAGDSFASVKDRFATVDASFAAVKNASLSTAKGKNTIAVSSVEVRPLAT